MSADVQIRNHGTVWSFQLLTEAAREWVRENVSIGDPVMQVRNGDLFYADHRPARDIAEGMRAAGLGVET